MRRALKKLILDHIHRNNEAFRVEQLGKGSYLDPQLWGLQISKHGHLTSSGVDFQELADTYGTPLHVVDKARLAHDYSTFLGACRAWYPDVVIGYSYKTNPLPGAIRVIHQLGGHAEVISHFELWLALKLGVPAEKIIFNGPAKTYKALEQAIENKIRIINIDSEDEIDIVAGLAEKYGHRQAVGVRAITSAGWDSQLGIPLADGRAYSAFERIVRNPHLSAQGIHFHLGTGMRMVEPYCRAIEEVLDFSVLLFSKLGINLSLLDFGGGFGVPTVQGFSGRDHQLMRNGYPPRLIDTRSCASMETFAEGIFKVVGNYLNSNPWLKPTIVFEPGRAISSRSQYLLLKVVGIKPGKNGRKYAFVDGGTNIAAPLCHSHHEVFPVSRMNEKADCFFDVAGPLCCPEDILIKVKKFPPLRKDDILAVMDAGAYFIPTQQNFSYPRPAVVLLDATDSGRLIRKRERFEDIVSLDQA